MVAAELSPAAISAEEASPQWYVAHNFILCSFDIFSRFLKADVHCNMYIVLMCLFYFFPTGRLHRGPDSG